MFASMHFFFSLVFRLILPTSHCVIEEDEFAVFNLQLGELFCILF